MAKQQLPDNMKDIILAADATKKAAMKIFNRTELASVPYTPENVAQAVQRVNFLTRATRSMVEMSCIERGMFLCWIKANLTKHGEFQKFCDEHFSDLPERTRRYAMRQYLIFIGEKKSKELPPVDKEDIIDDELIDAMMTPSADKAEKLPRASLVRELHTAQTKITKGTEQLQAARDQVAELQQQLEAARSGDLIPEHIKDEAARVEHVRAAYWKFVTFWLANLPDDPGLLKLHHSLCAELQAEMQDLWPNHLGPQAESNVDKAGTKKGRKRR